MTLANKTRTRAFWTAVFIIVILVAAPEARQVQPVAYSSEGVPVAAAATTTTIDLLVGRSTILNVGSAIARVSLTVPDIADALVTSPQQILIHGKAPGTISLFVWEKSGAIRTYEVAVRRDLSVLTNQLRQLFPGEPISVTGSGKDVVLSGRVTTPYVVEKAADVAIAYAEKKENVVNLLKLQEGMATNQVLLRVRFAEVTRSALQELGASLFADGRDGRFGRTSTQQFAAPFFDKKAADLGQTLGFSDYLNLFLFDAKEKLGAVVKALQGRGVFQSLAEPNLVATDGKEASFLAGGEYPYPVVQGASGGNAVTIMFKEFGVRLNFTPTILGGDLIRLKLRPEVSALDFNNAVVVEGFRVPALTTRRADTEVELQDGQTFAIAGLLNNTAVQQLRKVPGLGDIPILGLLFKSRAYQKEATELVVMITPTILRRGSTGVSEGMPTIVEPFLGRPSTVRPPPAPYTGSPRWPEQGRGSADAEPQAQPVPPAARPAQPQNSPRARPQHATSQSPPAPAPAPKTSGPAPAKLSKDEEKRIADARKREQEQRELEAKRQAEADRAAARAAAEEKKRQEEAARVALKKAEEDKKRLEQAAREQAERDAEAAKKAAEDKRKAEEQQKKLAAEEAKRKKALAEADAKLKEAQSAYEAVVRTPK